MTSSIDTLGAGLLAGLAGLRAAKVDEPRSDERYVSVPADLLARSCAHLAAEGARLIAIFGDDLGASLRINTVLAAAGGLLVLQADLDPADPRYPAITPSLPVAHWDERALRDLFGIVPEGHPWPEPLILHEEWAGDIQPLRASFSRHTVPLADGAVWRPPAVEGEGVFEIPYGPVRSGVFESALFLVRTAGEDILAMTPRMFYKHRGIEKLFIEAPLEQAVLVAEHASGVAAVAHSLAFCQAVERALGIEAPSRAAYIRTICAELERLHNHIDSLMRQCETASLGVGQAQFAMLKERVPRLNAELVGNRFLRGVNRIGGVRYDLDPNRRRLLVEAVNGIEHDFRKVVSLFLATASMRDRLITTGRLSSEIAQTFGAVGPVARGSGLEFDTRLDRPYAAYGQVEVIRQTQQAGDAMARTRVRIGEIYNSFSIIRQAAAHMPDGLLVASWAEAPAGPHALGWTEAPQGELLYAVRLGDDGRLARCAYRSPSFRNWSFYERTMPRNVLTDVGFIEHSFGLSQAGCDG